ncbi:MAG: NADP-dependent malic enzyme [candidate division KSB1 bacterium]|nr:NADP-dependent malic enzyme [candidate division KSB1 bacterium]MDZ7303518.1 NADP-dependent malic enzyme [candidate division KSB1 bacterium]MDZ7312680.1 NADP-dependent malic enzyme [candidate division KSB1 bacterium]
MISKEEALRYHSQGRKGKVEVISTKPCVTQTDLSLAYTPGVAEPCREIHKSPEAIWEYTSRGNLVAVVSNGTAVLGLGDIGAGAGKPVMEGKGVLFKRFADIDVFDIELDTHDADEIIRAVQLMEPTFGGINLEDIKAPECFYIEETLKKTMKIPVFHDDQHGTAIISGAALLNALELVGKDISKVKVVFSGAGASGIACANYYLSLGVDRRNLILCDTKGVVYAGRKEGMNPYKEKFAAETKARTLAEAMVGADVFVGLSGPNLVTKDMVRSMAKNPIIFAMANPDPEITYDEATSVRDDLIMATGRSDYPNQVNNVLGFPFIFRGALDVRATAINEEMKHAATRALADLAKQPVPYSVIKAYRLQSLKFGRDYIIPKPFDPRVLLWVAPAVAKAAMDTGVAQKPINLDKYREELEGRLGMARKFMRVMINKAKTTPKRIVYPEGDLPAILKACEIILDEGIAHPILLGDEKAINSRIEEMRVPLAGGVEIINPLTSPKLATYIEKFYELRKRKGITRREAEELMRDSIYFGAMMVHLGEADGLVAGLTKHYPETLRPALQIIKLRDGVSKVSGLYAMVFKDSVYFIADATVNIEPTAEDLAEIAMLAAKQVRRFNIEPRVALLSFSNFGSVKHPISAKVQQALAILRHKAVDFVVDGEMQADTAVVPEIVDEFYPFCRIKGGANVLIFPDLMSGNVAYKLLQRLGHAEAIGPILMGMKKPVHVLQIGSMSEEDVVNMTAIAVVEAQVAEK